MAEFDNIPYFDESKKTDGKNMFFIMGARSRVYPYGDYEKVFKNLPADNLVTLDAGHWVHFDKPIETLNTLREFLDKIDSF